jgi:hypothetical protein
VTRGPFVLRPPARGCEHVVEKFQAMKVREALNRLQDWQLMDLVEFHRDQEESYSLEQFRHNLERLNLL